MNDSDHIMAAWSESLCGLHKAVLATNVEESDRGMAADDTTKALVAPPPSAIIVWLCHCIMAIMAVQSESL